MEAVLSVDWLADVLKAHKSPIVASHVLDSEALLLLRILSLLVLTVDEIVGVVAHTSLVSKVLSQVWVTWSLWSDELIESWELGL